MMIGHIAVDGLDASGLPGSLSPTIINELLRDDMGFDGLVMTDDLDMGAILNHYGFADTMKMALAAGNDLLMICHRVEMAAEALDAIEGLPATQLDPALRRVAEFKAAMAPPDPFSIEAHRLLDDEVWKLRVATLGEELAAQRSAEDGKRSPVELY
jgi:beta-N-acetylhexosaminidase